MNDAPIPSQAPPDGPDRTGPQAAVDTWVSEVRALADEARTPGLANDLTDILVQAARPGVRVAVTATLARFSDLVVEQFLGRRVLPAERRSPDPVLVTVVPGPAPAADASGTGRTDGTSDTGDTGNGWVPLADGLEPPSRADGTARRGCRLRVAAGPGVSLPDGVELLSCPEVHDGGRTPVPPSLLGADAAVVVVSAAAPLTQHESRLIERLSAWYGSARLLVVVTRLDLVDPDERDELVAFVHRRAGALSLAPRVVVQEAGTGPEDPSARATLHAWLEAAVLPGAAAARRERLAHRLADCLSRVRETADERQRARKAREAARAEAREAARRAHEDELRVFDELRVEVQARHNQTLSEFLSDRDRFRERLLRDLLQQAKRSPDPAAWWQQEAVYQLDTRLSAWRAGARQALQETSVRYVERLDDRLERRFGVRTDASPRSGPADDVPPVDAGTLPVTPLRHRRLLYRMGPTGVAALGVLLVPGIGPVAGLVTSLVGTGLAEIRLRTLAEEQFQLVRRQLPPLVDTVLSAESGNVTAQLADAYRHMENAVLRLRRQWRSRGPDEGPEKPSDAVEDACDWADVGRRAGLLAERILAEAGRGPVITDAAGAASRDTRHRQHGERAGRARTSSSGNGTTLGRERDA
ncbi:hypothetical protein [Streptomyces sp. NPDC003688]